MTHTQDTFWADKALITEKLGFFIYGLIDPRDNRVFYVGKGGGLLGQGNDRPQNHLAEAREGKNSDSSKLQTIRAIWEAGKDVDLVILRRNISTGKATSEIEGTLIEMLNHLGPNFKLAEELTNEQKTYKGADCGLIHRGNKHEITADKFTGKKVSEEKPIKNVWFFNIGTGFREKLDDSKYEGDSWRVSEVATREAWKVSAEWRAQTEEEGGYVLGLKDGISLCAIKLEGWTPKQSEEGRFIVKGKRVEKDDPMYEVLAERDFTDLIAEHGTWKFGKHLIIDLYRDGFMTKLNGPKKSKSGRHPYP